MPLMTASDWAAMRVDLVEIRDDNAVSITLRRNNATLPAQTVRIARSGRGNVQDGAAAQASVAPVIVLGDTTFDVQPEDRFTHDGLLYQIEFVRPNRRVMVVAEAKAVA